MKHRKTATLLFFLLSLTLVTVGESPALAEDALRLGINDYNNENYEEAMGSLLDAVKQNPSSAEAAFYTGMTYKAMLDYGQAKSYLKKTLSLNPAMTEAYVPLAEVLYGLGEKGEAEATISHARSKGVKSARDSYLMGLILADKGKKKEASGEFRRAMVLEPASEAAALSGEALNTMGYKDSQFALTLGYTFQYDDNVILKPSDDVSGIPTDEKDMRHVLTAGGDYATSWGDVGLRAGYSFYQSLHQDLDQMDVQAHSLLLMPSLEINKGKVYLLGAYDYYRIDDEKYLGSITLKPSWTFSTEGGTGVNLFAGFISKDFLQDALSKDEDRDGTNVSAGLALLFPFNADRSFVKVDYAYDSEDTDGDNWDYSGHKGGVHLSHPLAAALEFTLGASYYLQDYKNTHSSFGKKREDKISSIDGGLTYSYKGFDFNIHYSYTDSDSNIAVYDYSRNIAGIGAAYTF